MKQILILNQAKQLQYHCTLLHCVPLSTVLCCSTKNTCTWDTNNTIEQVPQFTENSGVADIVKQIGNITSYKLFSSFVHDQLIEMINLQSITYFKLTYMQLSLTYAKISKTTSDEIRKFLAINLCMTVTKKRSYRDYWALQEDMQDSYVSRQMPVKRFRFLLRNIHLDDNSLCPKCDDADFDRLYKLRPFIDSLTQSFSRYYKPHQNVAVDECTVKFTGRSSL